MPIAPEERIQIPFTKALDGLNHLALERQPPHLAVGQHREAGLFLLGHRFVYGPVLDDLVAGSSDLARAKALLRGQQPRRPQQASDYVSVRRDHALLHGFLPAHRAKMKGCVRSFFFRKRDPARTLAGQPHPASNAQRSSGRYDPIMALERRSPACSRHHGRTLVVTIPMRLERQGG